MLLSGERQVAPTLDAIRRDHLARYEWAAREIGGHGVRVLDVACGVGYGALILAEAGCLVTAIDNDAEAIEYARTHYGHERITYRVANAADLGQLSPPFDVAVCFETIEHLRRPRDLLLALRAAPLLLASAPNEDRFPYRNYRFHFRHYTADAFEQLLAGAGFEITDWFGQADQDAEVVRDVDGRTLVAKARRTNLPVLVSQPETVEPSPVPEHVVILGLGPSLEAYVDLVKRLGGRRALSDEVWGINAVGDIIQCDRIFHMDDVRVQEVRAAAAPDSNIAHMLQWLRRHPGPIYTSRVHEDYPGLVEFPLEAVINSCGIAYFNSTAAYAVAYAVHIGVKQIGLFGFDFTYKDSHKAEKGRGCVEFHLGIAKARGIEIGFPSNTSLMDAAAPFEERIYGYDTLEVAMDGGGDQPVTVSFTPRPAPTAGEIESRYDHNRHPNRLVES